MLDFYNRRFRNQGEAGGSGNVGAGGQVPPGGQSDGQPAATNTQDVSSLPEWAQKLLRETRDEAAQYRTRSKDRDELQKRLKEIEDAQMSEIDKAKKSALEAEERLKDYEAQLRAERVALAIERQARKMNLVDGEMAMLAIQGKVEFDEEGQPTNIIDLLSQLAQDKPYLVAAQSGATVPGAGASAANPPRGSAAQAGTIRRSDLANRAFYVQNREAIDRAMREGRIVDE